MIFQNHMKTVATCSRKEVRRFKRIARENKKFSVDDLVNVKPGDYLVLRGYPCLLYTS